MKPGYKTTEFWLSLAAMIVGAIMASGLLEKTASPIDNQIVGIIVSVLAALGYTVGRGFVKAADSKATAIIAAANAENPPKP